MGEGKRNLTLRIRDWSKYGLHASFLPNIYRYHSGKPIEKNLVLFADAKNSRLPFSMQEMYEKLILCGYKVENWCVDFDDLSLKEKVQYLVSFMKRYARAEYIFICDYFLPVSSCKKRKETKVIQLWHSCGMLKKFGYDAKDDLGGRQALQATKNIDLWTVSADICVPAFEKATHLYDGQVQALGISRSDIFFSEDYKKQCAEKFYKKYPELKRKKLILWAPTFRGNAKAADLLGMDEIKKLQEKLGDRWKILIKLHPHLVKEYHADNCDFPTEQLYPVVDLLITDYSSVIFEYSIFEKPFLIYAPDYDEYIKLRGCYINLENELPGFVLKDPALLQKKVLDIRLFSPEIVKRFKQKYMQQCNGDSTARITEYLKHLKNEG